MFLAEGHQREETTSRSNVAQSRFIWTRSLARCLGDDSSLFEWCNPAVRSEKQIYRREFALFFAQIKRLYSRSCFFFCYFHKRQNFFFFPAFEVFQSALSLSLLPFFNFFHVSLRLTVFCVCGRACAHACVRRAQKSREVKKQVSFSGSKHEKGRERA